MIFFKIIKIMKSEFVSFQKYKFSKFFDRSSNLCSKTKNFDVSCSRNSTYHEKTNLIFSRSISTLKVLRSLQTFPIILISSRTNIPYHQGFLFIHFVSFEFLLSFFARSKSNLASLTEDSSCF